MSVFTTYLQLGFWHMCSWQATDHLTFLLALCAPYVLADWRRVVALVTSFTVGYSLTLALATLGLVPVNQALVEALLPVTSMLAALVNMHRAGPPLGRAPMRAADGGSVVWAAPNWLAAGFGLVHGLGYARQLLRLLGPAPRPVAELLSFNLGVELGQLAVVGVILLLGLALLRGLGVARRDWVLAVSGAALGVAVLLLVRQLTG